MKRYLILVACMVMLVCLGTGQAWSAFAGPLKKEFGLSAFESQFIFNTITLLFCTTFVVGGRLHDRFGPRPLAVAGAALVGGAWFLASWLGASYFWLWLSLGILGGTGAALGYVSPIATAVKWFPNRRGLISGFAAAGFAAGPIVTSLLVEMLVARGWRILDIFRFIGATYAPVILVTGLCLSTPPQAEGEPGVAEANAFRRRALLRDPRFWALFAGMLCGTLPYLVVMGSVKEMAVAFSLGKAALYCIGVMAAGNAAGRIFWGFTTDRIGTRRSMLSALTLLAGLVLALMLFGWMHPAVFLVAGFGIGFCYGSNFAIYPSAVSHLYGTHVLGTVYPLIMVAQGASSFFPSLNGLLVDVSGSYLPGLGIAFLAALAGIIVCAGLSRGLHHKRT